MDIVQIRAATFHTTGGTIQMSLERYGVNWSTWVASAGTRADSTTMLDESLSGQATGRDILDSGAITETMDTQGVFGNGSVLLFRMTGDPMRIHDIEITFEDTGPINI